MKTLRIGCAAAMLAFVALPLLAQFRAIRDPAVWQWTADDLTRLRLLTENTALLCAGTVGLAIPLGILLAVLLFRTTFIGRRALLMLTILMLFVPLPAIVSAWQALLGSQGLLPLEVWRDSPGRPWSSGMGPAIWIHAVAAIPWATLIIGIGLAWVEPEREQEAALRVAPLSVLALVTLPRAQASIFAAALFVILQTAGEITVTDMMLVRTLAEETHTQFTIGQAHALARTLIVCMPMLLTTWIGVLFAFGSLERTLPPLVLPARSQRPLEIGPVWARCLAGGTLLMLLALPLASLAHRLGLVGHPLSWDSAAAARFLLQEATVHGGDVPRTLGVALLTGLGVALAALVGCWLARESPPLRWLLFGAAAWAWVLPAPIVGIAVQDAILAAVDVWPSGPAATILYYNRSPAPLMWAHALRALPIAIVFLWPIVRMLPRELIEEVRLAGASPLGEFAHVVWPMTWRATLVTALGAAAVCMSEVGASARVETPGWESFAKLLFVRMHDGAHNTVAALSLLMLGAIALLLGAGWVLWRRRDS